MLKYSDRLTIGHFLGPYLVCLSNMKWEATCCRRPIRGSRCWCLSTSSAGSRQHENTTGYMRCEKCFGGARDTGLATKVSRAQHAARTNAMSSSRVSRCVQSYIWVWKSFFGPRAADVVHVRAFAIPNHCHIEMPTMIRRRLVRRVREIFLEACTETMTVSTAGLSIVSTGIAAMSACSPANYRGRHTITESHRA